MDSIIPVIVAAAGLIITMGIQRYFDFRNLKKTHELGLAKEFFLKMLAAAENATAKKLI